MLHSPIDMLGKKMGVYKSSKSIDPCLPAQFAQADLNRNFLILVIFLNVERSIPVQNSVNYLKKNGVYGFMIMLVPFH